MADQSKEDHASDVPRPPPPFQYGLFTLLLVMLLVGVGSAGLGGLIRGGGDTVAYVLIVIAAPVGSMVILSLAYAFMNRRR